MFAVCSAFAIATESSLKTFSAAATLTGAATLALISDIAARSGSSSPASASSSSLDRLLYCSPIAVPPFRSRLARLVDRGVLCRVRIRDRAVRQDVRRDGGIDRDGDVRVDQRHGRPLR